MSVTSVLDKLNDLAIQTEIADLSELANGLLEKAPKARGKDIKDVATVGHRRYPHLVPMYRQVHRKIPRPKTFKAIRWVNPKRMFPGAGLTKAEMMKMSNSELEKIVVDINTYREEAYVIHSRYNQMIDLIERGQSPYFIPYANITEPSWLKLEGHMGRAKRLKAGTVAWEHSLDVQANDIRSILLMKDREGGPKKFDNIGGLWEGPDGEPRAPMFMDVKKPGQAMRKTRTVDGKRLNVDVKAFPRRFIAIRPEDIVSDERVGMPAEGIGIAPNMVQNPKHREILEAQGAMGMHLLRIPKVPWMMTGPEQKELQQNGQLLTVPPGREKNPVAIFFDKVPAEFVADRPFAKKPPGAEPDREPPARERALHSQSIANRQRAGRGADREERKRREAERAEERKRQLAEQERLAREKMASRNGLPDTATQGLLQQMNLSRDADLATWNAVDNIFGGDQSPLDSNKRGKPPETVGYTNGKPLGQIKPRPRSEGGGVRARMNLTVQMDGKAWVYKPVLEDSRGEMFAFMMDRALDLNIVPSIHVGQLGMKETVAAFEQQWGAGKQMYNEPFEHAQKGGGHFMELCSNCVRPGDDRRAAGILKGMMGTKEGRNEFNKLVMLDFITGNYDRHRYNWLVTPEGKMVAIDNAYSGWSKPYNTTITRTAGQSGGFSGVPKADWSDVKNEDGSAITRAQVQDEAGEFFDEHFDIDKLQQAAKTTKTAFRNTFSPQEVATLRQSFINTAVSSMQTGLNNMRAK